MAEERRAIHAYLSNEAHDGWTEFAEGNGVTISAVVEAMGSFWMSEVQSGAAADGLDPFIAARARKIDAERRKRKRS